MSEGPVSPVRYGFEGWGPGPGYNGWHGVGLLKEQWRPTLDFEIVKGKVMGEFQMTVEDAVQHAYNLQPSGCNGFRFFDEGQVNPVGRVIFYNVDKKYLQRAYDIEWLGHDPDDDREYLQRADDLESDSEEEEEERPPSFKGSDSEGEGVGEGFHESTSFVWFEQSYPGSLLALRIVSAVFKYTASKLREYRENLPVETQEQWKARNLEEERLRKLYKEEARIRDLNESLVPDSRPRRAPVVPSMGDYRMLVERALAKFPEKGVDIIAEDQNSMRRYVKLMKKSSAGADRGGTRVEKEMSSYEKEYHRVLEAVVGDCLMAMSRLSLEQVQSQGPGEISIVWYFCGLQLSAAIETVLRSLPGSPSADEWVQTPRAKQPRKLTIRR